MELKTYLSQERGRASALAKACGVSSVTMHQWAYSDEKQVPAERCPEIEILTNRAVTCEELRPDLADKWAYLRGTARVAA